jgi:hypothetical protein
VTVISDQIENIAGADNATTFTFYSPVVRDSDDGTALITTLTTAHLIATAGVLTTPDLDPGPATVRIGLHAFEIEIPDSPTPVRLWPLVEAGLPVSADQVSSAVINGGGARRIQVMTAAEYAALVAITTPDPGSIFFVY